MKIITLHLKHCPYQIATGSGILGDLAAHIRRLAIGTDAYIITNAAVKRRFGSRLQKALASSAISAKFRLIPDSERSKSMDTAYAVLKDLARYDKNKRLFIIAFGGGVVGDLSGFVASVYRRGTAYVNIPTTLLAQVDSAIGGKTAVDLPEGKNLIGSFYQPRLVFSDIELLKTLGAKQLRAGLAEVIKYGIIKDAPLFSYLETHFKDILSLRKGALEFIVARCSSIKAGFVELDERDERGVRAFLNFGHTIGHALEAACGYKGYTHGEAVALGMLVAADISEALGLTDARAVERIDSLIAGTGLPVQIRGLTLNAIIKAHYHDKKFIGVTNRFVLLRSIGHSCLVKNIPLDIIKDAVRKRLA